MGPIHAGLCELLEAFPRLVVEALVRLGYIPDLEWRIELRATEALLPDRQRSFKEVRADLVLLLRPPLDASGKEPGEDACIAILLENQLVIDWAKLTRWRSFGLAYRPDLCPHVFLVSLTLAEDTELWLRRDIQCWIDDMRMTVVSPRNVAWDPAKSPADALLCGVFDPNDASLAAAIESLPTFPAKRRMVYEEMLLSLHGKERVMTILRKLDDSKAQAILDRWPGYEPNEMELKSFLYVRGEEHGFVHAIVELLEQRGLPVDDTIVGRLYACGDVTRLRELLRRAVRVESADQLFA